MLSKSMLKIAVLVSMVSLVNIALAQDEVKEIKADEAKLVLKIDKCELAEDGSLKAIFSIVNESSFPIVLEVLDEIDYSIQCRVLGDAGKQVMMQRQMMQDPKKIKYVTLAKADAGKDEPKSYTRTIIALIPADTMKGFNPSDKLKIHLVIPISYAKAPGADGKHNPFTEDELETSITFIVPERN